MVKTKIAVLISGNGSNLQAIINACNDQSFPAEVGLVISNRDGASGITRAEQAGIPNIVINHQNFSNCESFDKAMHKVMAEHGIEFICMAGFMRLLSEWLIDKYYNKILNIHPSLLPSFKGINAQEQALKAGVKISGCTVHYARQEMDSGPILVQAAVPVLPDDNIQSLTKRILIEEHKCYPQAIRIALSDTKPK